LDRNADHKRNDQGVQTGNSYLFFFGIYDLTVSYTLAKEYVEKLQALIKRFYTFIKSAHSPIFEEPEKVRQIIEFDVLQGGLGLADENNNNSKWYYYKI